MTIICIVMKTTQSESGFSTKFILCYNAGRCKRNSLATNCCLCLVLIDKGVRNHSTIPYLGVFTCIEMKSHRHISDLIPGLQSRYMANFNYTSRLWCMILMLCSTYLVIANKSVTYITVPSVILAAHKDLNYKASIGWFILWIVTGHGRGLSYCCDRINCDGISWHTIYNGVYVCHGYRKSYRWNIVLRTME